MLHEYSYTIVINHIVKQVKETTVTVKAMIKVTITETTID